MLCASPYISIAGRAHGCGRCLPCLFNRRRLWTIRNCLENRLHSDSSYVTLTYSDDELPLIEKKTPTLLPAHYQLWLKRLRTEWHRRQLHEVNLEALRRRVSVPKPTTRKLRYFMVGEYGEKDGRPHYHALVYGLPTCLRGGTHRPAEHRGRPIWWTCCPNCILVGKTWGRGDIVLGTVAINSIQYVCQYVTKKMTHGQDPRLVDGQEPEFARMSLKPGIGRDAMWDVASSFMQFDLETRMADVPSAVQEGKRIMPLGRYLRSSLREMLGRPANAPPETMEEIEKELHVLRQTARKNKSSLKEEIRLAFEGRRLALIAQRNIYDTRKKL